MWSSSRTQRTPSLYNRLTGALDLFNAGKPGADWGWVRMPNTVNLEIAERLKHVNTTEQPAQP
jgi:hypothetical protein